MALRVLYTLLWCLVLPWLPIRLWWRGRREPGYREYIGERFGRFRIAATQPVIWVHAVSLGETRAAAPLIERLRQSHPDATVLLTHMTATGRAAGRSLFGNSVVQAWLPYDLPFAVRGFLAHFRPCVGLILETELWPNLFAGAQDAGVPVYLVNARLSQRSARGYARIGSLSRAVLGTLSGVAAQAAADAQRLEALGAPPPVITGNVKFDLGLSDAAAALGQRMRTSFGAARPVFVAGSTREGEEALILDAMACGVLPPDLLTVIVPRHPQRFDAVAALLQARSITFVRRSSNVTAAADVRVILGDSMGEMMGYYAAADVVFIGGSLLPLGGQNLIEPIAAGVPTIVGPHMFNFADATARAREAGAVIEVGNADALFAAVGELLTDPSRRAAMRQAALAFHAAHRGAADRLWAWLAPKIAAALSRRDPTP
jgi:3-deoxy-D-manno-octulosonic-acid transferase